jgi:hypothetical protein
MTEEGKDRIELEKRATKENAIAIIKRLRANLAAGYYGDSLNASEWIDARAILSLSVANTVEQVRVKFGLTRRRVDFLMRYLAQMFSETNEAAFLLGVEVGKRQKGESDG